MTMLMLVLAAVALQAPVPGGREIFRLGADPGGLPATVRLLGGGVTLASRDGVPMLKATTPTEILITLPEALPQDFTLEFDIVPKQCCNREDLALEGTGTLSRSSSSAQILWHRTYQNVMGGGPDYQAVTPSDLQETTAGQLTTILISVEGETVKLYTNGRRLYTLTERRFARGQVLRVFLGGENDGDRAVYLARLRVTAGAAVAVAQTQSGMSAETVTGSGGGGTGSIRPAGGTPATVAPAPAPLVIAPASAGAIAAGPRATAANPTPSPPPPPALPPPPSPPPPPPPPSSPAPVPAPPVGVGEGSSLQGQPEPEPPPEPEEIVQTAPAASSILTIDGVSFAVLVRKGGSAAAQVVEVTMSDGTIKKQLSTIKYEPLVVDVAPGSPLDGWANSTLTGVYARKNGSLSGGAIPAGQQLQFRDALITSVTVPVLDGSNTNPAYLGMTIVPEEIIQTALNAPATGTMNAWQASDFRLVMGNLVTNTVARIEPLTGSMELNSDALGEQRVATAAPGKRTISNLRVTLATSDAAPATSWLEWFDDFVIKGNNGDDKERTFTLELGVGKRTDVSGVQRTYTAANLLNLKGSGVGIIAVRWLPPPAATSARMLQVDLYMERLEVVP